MSGLPAAAGPFVAFATVLRTHGFAVAPEQTTAFLAAVGLLGPRGLDDVRRAARATLAPPPERRDEFDALFRAHFLGELTLAAAAEGDDTPETLVHDDEGVLEILQDDAETESGRAAAASEALSTRRFGRPGEADALRRLARRAPSRLPTRRSRRRRPGRRAGPVDLRRVMREAVRHDGDVMRLPRLRRRRRQRPVLLLLDVSGSMKEGTEARLRFAHALARATDRLEVFTIGTRLTRVTRALRRRDPEQALGAAAGLVPDWDGGTRLGDALAAFLAVPRFAGFARGALTLIVSDGLERGDPAALAEAVERLSRLSWRLAWLTPLAADPRFRPETAALAAVLPLIDDLADGSSGAALCSYILGEAG